MNAVIKTGDTSNIMTAFALDTINSMDKIRYYILEYVFVSKLRHRERLSFL